MTPSWRFKRINQGLKRQLLPKNKQTNLYIKNGNSYFISFTKFMASGNNKLKTVEQDNREIKN